MLRRARLGPIMLLVVASATLAGFDPKVERRFPAGSAVVDVTKPPYEAKGDGVADDTRAIQRAILDTVGMRRILYFPKGTYLVSDTLAYAKKNASGMDAWGFNWIVGEIGGKTVLRLKSGTFRDRAKPGAVLWCGGFGSADWFHNHVENLTIEVDRNNAGAVGLQFYTNNIGSIRNVRIVSVDGGGVAGLDLAHRDMNGPMLVKNVEVQGFETGVLTGNSVNSQTFEHLSLTGQSKIGFLNLGQSVSLRGLRSRGAPTAVRAEGFTALIDADLEGAGAFAIEGGDAPFFARNVKTKGYAQVLKTRSGGRESLVAGPNLVEFHNGRITNPFDGPTSSLNLAVEETPEAPWDDPKSWAVVDAFGADPTGDRDSAEAIQKALDSSATTVFFPGSYNVLSPIHVRGKVRRLLGVGGWIDYSKRNHPDMIIEDGAESQVFVEHFAPVNGGIEVATNRTVVFRSVEANLSIRHAETLFFEDFGTGDLRIPNGARAWARQLNVENEGTHITNDGGSLWILGLKTERGGTLVRTKNRGRTEIFGNFSYTTTAGKLAPMLVVDDASAFVFFNEVCYSGDPFATLIRETRGGKTVEIRRGEGGTAPYAGRLD